MHRAGGSTAGPTSGGADTASIDSCLVGTWKLASEHMQLDLPEIGAITLIGQGLVSHVHPDGSVEKQPLNFPSLNLAFTFAVQDLKSLWPWYRYGYEKEMTK